MRRRLGPGEARRRFWHMVPGAIPFLLVPVLRNFVVPVSIRRAIALGLTSVFVALLLVESPAIRRRGEASTLPSILGYAVPVLAAFLIFPKNLEVGFTVLVILALGDGSATMGGILLPRGELPWNERKSWGGFFCFVLFGGLAAAAVCREQAHFSWLGSLLFGGGVSLVCAVVESLPVEINDNPRVGVAGLATTALAHYLIGGHA